uniref:Uncharacterized protein n=1 Tax=Sus scrofa TaxID=9823 RepID=A0A8D1K2L5_PIG
MSSCCIAQGTIFSHLRNMMEDNVRKRKCICVTGSLCCTVEIDNIVNYFIMEKIKIIKKEKKWYLITLPESLMSSNGFLMVSLGFFRYSILSSANSDSFASSFPIWIPFISFSSLIAMTRTSKTMLNGIGKSRHPLLVADLSRNSLSFSPLTMMLAVGLSYMAFIMLR